MRSLRQHQIDVALAKCLEQAAPYLLPEGVLKADAGRLVVPRPTNTELADSIRYHDTAGRLTSVQGETEAKYKLNEDGRAWLQENR